MLEERHRDQNTLAVPNTELRASLGATSKEEGSLRWLETKPSELRLRCPACLAGNHMHAQVAVPSGLVSSGSL